MPEFQFEGLQDFMAMGGYAYYVWTSYLFFAFVVVWCLLQPKLERRKVLQLHKASMQRERLWSKTQQQQQSQHQAAAPEQV
ncbi:MAG: heme exporter protein CcmD [Pseudohongiellaceae bacterium]